MAGETKREPLKSKGTRAKAAQGDPLAPAYVNVTLAHHLPEGNPFHEDGEPVKPGDEIEVTYDQGRQLLAGGYLLVDPADSEAVKAIFKGALPPEAAHSGGGQPPANG